MTPTETSYLGFRLPHPFVVGASPFGYSLDGIRRVEDAGAAAIVLHSFFEEQLTMFDEPAPLERVDRDIEATMGEFPPHADYRLDAEAYAEHVDRVKRAVGIPVIASVNGTSPHSWLRFARILEMAGADALELNPYAVVTSPDVTGGAVEDHLVATVAQVKRELRIPVAVKLSPFFSATANLAHRLDQAGADALVLFNRFYQPDIDIRTMQVVPTLELSTNAELRLRLRWVAILSGRLRCGLALGGGVEGPDDGIKAILAGADAVQMVSALLRHGPMYLREMIAALERFLEWHKAASLAEIRGRCSLQRTAQPAAFERAQYIRTLHSWTR
jgi:dihydroorotate dehydrogenase (fumarate)